jgi:hypothetical protein
VDSRELGDSRLSWSESNARERESLLKTCAKKKIYGQEELEDPERSGGARLEWRDFLHRLQNCNPGILPKDGKPGSVALYVRKRSEELSESDFDPATRPDDEFFIYHKYVGGFEQEPLPEYSSIGIDSSHLATGEWRGWRSVLLGLIKARVISYREALREFGDPTFDARSTRWFEQTADYR